MRKLTLNRYVIAILDQDNARGQCGLYFLNSVHTMEDIVTKFGISKRMKTALGDRWEIHVSHMPACEGQSKQSLKNISGIILSLIKRLEALGTEVHQETDVITITLPANCMPKDNTSI